MGNSSKYVKSEIEIIEEIVKEGGRIMEIKYEVPIEDLKLLELRFPPYNSTILHLCAWYNNVSLLEDLVPIILESDPNFVNVLDNNSENALIVSCVMDNYGISKILINDLSAILIAPDSPYYLNNDINEYNNIKNMNNRLKNTNEIENETNRKLLNNEVAEKISTKDPTMICCFHDSVNCFKELNPNFSDSDNRFGELHEVAKMMQSEQVLRILEDIKEDNEGWESNFTLLLENQPKDLDQTLVTTEREV